VSVIVPQTTSCDCTLTARRARVPTLMKVTCSSSWHSLGPGWFLTVEQASRKEARRLMGLLAL
jgi:hypothetical protein